MVVDGEDDVAGMVEAEMVCAIDFERDGLGIGVGGEIEVELEAMVVAVEESVDARVEGMVFDGRVVGDVGVPLRRIVTDKVVGLAAQWSAAGDGGLACAEKLEMYRVRRE